MQDPNSLASDPSGNVYIAEPFEGVIEKVTPAGNLSIFAGTGISGTPTPGPATTSDLDNPQGVAVDSEGNVYIADSGNRYIEKVTPSGTLSIVAGNGVTGLPTPGPATSSKLDYPVAVAVDEEGNIFIDDTFGGYIEKVNAQGVLSIFAGNGVGDYITPPTPGAATQTEIAFGYGIATDPNGNLYVAAPYAHVVSKITSGGVLSNLAGTGTGGLPTPGPASSSDLSIPYGVVADASGNVWISDLGSFTVDRVDPHGDLSIFAGISNSAGNPTPGPAGSSKLGEPIAMAFSASGRGNMYIADQASFTVDQVSGIFPAKPTSAVATSYGSEVTLNWQAPSTGPTPTGYSITPIVNGVAQTPVTVSGSKTTYVLPGAKAGDTYSFTASALDSYGQGPESPISNSLTIDPSSPGYNLIGADGGVFNFGPRFDGSAQSVVTAPVVGMASTNSSSGYWIASKDGGVYTYGNGVFHGSVPGLGLNVDDIVGIAADEATGGYWLVSSDGSVYSFDAPFFGSLPGIHVSTDTIVGIASSSESGGRGGGGGRSFGGYDLVGSDGAVYAFGGAIYHGGANTLADTTAPITGITVDQTTGGYWEASSDGGVYSYDAPFHGSATDLHLAKPIVGIASADNGNGYWLVGADGGVFAYNCSFSGSMSPQSLAAPIVGIAAAPTNPV